MDKSKKQPGRKRNGKQVSFDFKLYLINKINNGRISVNYAALAISQKSSQNITIRSNN